MQAPDTTPKSDAAASATPPHAGNGAAPPAAPAPTEEQLRQLAQQDVMLSAAFARIVAILMRSPQYKHLALTDLEWLVMPPLLLGQYAMIDGKFAGVALPVPAAVALWASVSAEVDERLSANLTAPIRLRPDEWRSGETLWLIDVIGDQHAIPHLMQQLQAGPFKGRAAKMRMVGRDGKVVVAGLGEGPAKDEPTGGAT